MAIACKTTCKGRASEREESNVCLAPLRMYAAPSGERASRVGVRLVIICFRVSDPDNGTTDGGEGRNDRDGNGTWQKEAKLFFPHAKEVRNGAAMQNARGMRNGSGDS